MAAGEIWTSRKLLPRLVEELTHRPLPLGERNGTSLTRQEHEILRFLCEGLANKAIAERLTISEATVKTHLNHIFKKTGLHSRLQLSRLLQAS